MGTATNSIICTEKEKHNLPICHMCSEPVEPWLTKKNTESKSHFDCNHTNHMHERCTQLWMLEKRKKNCPECRAEGHLKVEGDILEKDRTAGAQLTQKIENFLELTTSSTHGFIAFKWDCFNRNPETKEPLLKFGDTMQDFSVVLRLVTVAQKNNVLVKELYLKQPNPASDSFFAFLKYLSDNPGKHGNLITYLQQCKKDFELVSKFMPFIINYWNTKRPLYPPAVDYSKLDESVKNNYETINQYVELQKKFTPFTTLTILNHPIMKTVTFGSVYDNKTYKNIS